MAKQPETYTLTQEQLASILSTFQKTQNAGNPEFEDFMRKQNQILDKKLREDEEKERVALEQRKQGAYQQQKRRNAELERQSQCAHIKPNRATALAGQRDHNNNVHYICQLCSKQWEDGESPHSSLIPDSIFIGGPIH